MGSDADRGTGADVGTGTWRRGGTWASSRQMQMEANGCTRMRDKVDTEDLGRIEGRHIRIRAPPRQTRKDISGAGTGGGGRRHRHRPRNWRRGVGTVPRSTPTQAVGRTWSRVHWHVQKDKRTQVGEPRGGLDGAYRACGKQGDAHRLCRLQGTGCVAYRACGKQGDAHRLCRLHASMPRHTCTRDASSMHACLTEAPRAPKLRLRARSTL